MVERLSDTLQEYIPYLFTLLAPKFTIEEAFLELFGLYLDKV